MTFFFPVSGVEVFPLWPFLVAFLASLLTSIGGVSGAFLLLPYQVSVLGFSSPAVSSTNLVFNLIAIPIGIYRLLREGRMFWPLAWVVVLGSLPGMLLGAYMRLRYLSDPREFKFFVGIVLLYIGARIAWRLLCRGRGSQPEEVTLRSQGAIRTIEHRIWKTTYRWQNGVFSYNPIKAFIFALIVGVVGGVYGIGGGAMLAPILVSVFGLPIHTIAGATLSSTFITSIAGIIFYIMLGPLIGGSGATASPDWILGGVLGLGGLVGVYIGTRLQKHVPPKWIELMLTLVTLYLASAYVVGYF